MKHNILHGDGTKACPYYIFGHRNEEFRSIAEVLKFCEELEINRLNIAHSGTYYTQKDGEWYITSDTESCDKYHSLPPNGRKINVNT